MIKPVVLRVVQRSNSAPQRTRDGKYTVVEVPDLEGAASYLKDHRADLLVVDAATQDDVARLSEIRRTRPELSVVLIAPEASPNGLYDEARPAGQPLQPVAAALMDLAAAGEPAASDAGGPRAAPAAGPGYSAGIVKTLAFLHSSFWRNDLTLDVVAREAFMSRFHFSRTFKRQTGVRYIDYLTRLRLDMARDMLQTTERSVTSICFAVGYNDLTHFERMFKKRFGLSPSSLRQQHRAQGQSGRDAAPAVLAFAETAV